MGIIIWPGQTPDDDMEPALPTWVEEEEALERAELKELVRQGLESRAEERMQDEPDAIGDKLDYLIQCCVADDEVELSGALLLVRELRTAGGASGLMELVMLIMADLRKSARCRVCGCSNDHACDGGCHWVAADLCSRCAAAVYGIVTRVIRSGDR